MRAFSLAAERCSGAVSCGVTGAFVGDVPLLQAVGSGPTTQWIVRALPELNEELSTQYGLPIDVGAKADALALIAAAFNRGDLAMAAIATVQMQFPDPPLTEGRETDEEIARRALELHSSRLLKFWDPAKHPRTGTPPNPGWFASEPDTTAAAPVIPVASRPPWFWPWEKSRPLPGSVQVLGTELSCHSSAAACQGFRSLAAHRLRQRLRQECQPHQNLRRGSQPPQELRKECQRQPGAGVSETQRRVRRTPR